MRGTRATWIVAVAIALVGCGGSGKPAEGPEEAKVDEPAEPKPEPKTDQPKTDEPTGEAPEGGEPKGEGKGASSEPVFKEDMSVDDAINAVPQGTPRVNVDQEALGKPLMEESLYKPCKAGPAQHFKIRVGVWEGKAVGIDVTATPKNPKLEACIKQQIRTVTWKDKVKSLNTVDYAF